jgi:hypothetical protein
MDGLAVGWMELKEAAAKYQRAPATLRQAVLDGRLPASRIGHTLIVEEAAVRAYVARSEGRRGRPPGSKDRQPRGRPRKHQDPEA